MLKQPKQQRVVPNSFRPAAYQTTVNMSVFWLCLTLSMGAADMLNRDQSLARGQHA